MTVWRPRPAIRVVALGLHRRGGGLLAVDVLDDSGRLKGVRPPGGGVRFGERWDDALRREFREELEIEITVSGPPLCIENIYEHHGAVGHEIVLAAEIAFPEGAFAGRDSLTLVEDDGGRHAARWHDLATLDGPGPALFPAGLRALLTAETRDGRP